MLQELLPRDAPKPGYGKALLRHAGPRLVFPGGRVRVRVILPETQPREKRAARMTDDSGRLVRSMGLGARGRLPGLAAVWAACDTAAMGGLTRGGSSRRPLLLFPGTVELVSLRPPFGTAQACRGERSQTWRWPPVSCLCPAGPPDFGLSAPPR